jgi:hypothetical protein
MIEYFYPILNKKPVNLFGVDVKAAGAQRKHSLLLLKMGYIISRLTCIVGNLKLDKPFILTPTSPGIKFIKRNHSAKPVP